LFVLFVFFTLRNSVGNIIEIISLLDKKTLTGEQVSENYEYLVKKWGEWIIIGGDSGIPLVRFINIKAALFSGLMITFLILACVCLIIALLGGKLIFPKLVEYYKDTNQDMANLATLETNTEIKKLKENLEKEKEKEEEWF
jgi:hypothetical protein